MGYEKVEFPEGTTFLVTGAAGFIGSNLVEALLKKGFKVRGLDNLSTGRIQNVKEFLSDERFEFIEGDIRDIETCKYTSENIDYILHQAALGSVPRSIKEPLLYEENNIKGTANVMEAAKINNVKRVVYASSSSVYGDSPTLPKIEGDEGNVLSPYALTKKVNELYGKLYTELYELECIGLRYFNVFGKRQDPNSQYSAVIPKFVKSLINNKTPIIYGDGKQSRDFTYIENVIEANLKACKASKEATGLSYNIAFGSRNSLIEIYYELCEKLEKNIEPEFGPERAGDIKHSNANIDEAKTLLDYNPEYNFIDGLNLTINWYENNL
ncbi:SDR family oxidoreductase [Salinicoccus roseus]|uniref:SDR family oxidoreductase n=1 Tax=Salinicoccus roseus TaxID=45670 RepID=UPI0023019431|nr:SDR family oxidoreductase [Salinicoccus roseus]